MVSAALSANHVCFLSDITTPAPHQLNFYKFDALPDAQQTVSNHWRQYLINNEKEKKFGLHGDSLKFCMVTFNKMPWMGCCRFCLSVLRMKIQHIFTCNGQYISQVSNTHIQCIHSHNIKMNTKNVNGICVITNKIKPQGAHKTITTNTTRGSLL